jgi:AraC family transcriptional regulator
MNRSYGPGKYRDLLTSNSANWRSLFLRVRELAAPYADPVETPALQNPAICLFLNETCRVDHFSDGRWCGLDYAKGTGVLTPPGHTRVLRFDLGDQKSLATQLLLVPQDTVDFVANEVQKPGTQLKTSVCDVPFLDDPVISSFGSSAVSALLGGAPDFYAQAAAQWIAAHLLLGHSKGIEWRQLLTRERISDYRLVRVLEYIKAHLSDRLDLRVLSKEAGISPFHFAALFSKAVGATPHRHVQHLRMETAKAMLRGTDKSVLEIALTSGFRTASHFAAAFRQQFSQSPTEYRLSHQSFCLDPERGRDQAAEAPLPSSESSRSPHLDMLDRT